MLTQFKVMMKNKVVGISIKTKLKNNNKIIKAFQQNSKCSFLFKKFIKRRKVSYLARIILLIYLQNIHFVVVLILRF